MLNIFVLLTIYAKKKIIILRTSVYVCLVLTLLNKTKKRLNEGTSNGIQKSFLNIEYQHAQPMNGQV